MTLAARFIASRQRFCRCHDPADNPLSAMDLAMIARCSKSSFLRRLSMIKSVMDRRSLSAATLSVLGVVCFTLASFALPGCGTVSGVGQDIQYAADKTGEAMSGDR
jgi:predicted small secreted protein